MDTKCEHEFVSKGHIFSDHCAKCMCKYVTKEPMDWKPCPRADGRMEYLCEHGIGHGGHIHGCDGCCSRKDYPGKKKDDIVFGYRCQECGKGDVIKTIVKKYHTKMKGEPFIVTNAIIGVCDKCSAEHFSSKETKRWDKEFLKRNVIGT